MSRIPEGGTVGNHLLARGGRTVTAALASLGPFFAVCTHPAGADPQPPWRPLTELTDPRRQRGRLLARTESVRRALADQGDRPATAIPLRVAASVMHLGLVARLIAPAIAAVALGRPDLLASYPSGLWWQDELGGPVPLSIPVPRDPGQGHAAHAAHATRATRADQDPGRILHRLIDAAIEPITATVAGLADVSPRVLWGNVASAGNGAATQIAAAQIAAAQPGLAPAAWAAAAALASHPRLGTEPVTPGPAFRRSSCCLIYQLSPGQPRAVCGDCILLR